MPFDGYLCGGSITSAPPARDPLRWRSILIVEDEPLIALDIATAFEQVGAKASITAACATLTLDEALAKHIAVVIADPGQPFGAV